jgi:hypothetical protein
MDRRVRTVRERALPMVARLHSMLDAVAVFGLAGSIGWLAGLLAETMRPHLPWVGDQ